MLFHYEKQLLMKDLHIFVSLISLNTRLWGVGSTCFIFLSLRNEKMKFKLNNAVNKSYESILIMGSNVININAWWSCLLKTQLLCSVINFIT